MGNLARGLTSALEGSRPVVVKDGQPTSAGALGARVRGLAAWLSSQGVEPGDRALVLVPPGPDLIATVLALLSVGAAAVLADPDQPRDVFEAQVDRAAPRWVVADPHLVLAWKAGLLLRLCGAGVRSLPRRPARGRVLSLPGRAKGEGAFVPRVEDDEACVIFTSGTTSRPRGVVHTHGSLGALLENVRGVVGGLGFDSYIAETVPQLFYGLALDAVCHVAGGRRERRVQNLWRLLEAQKVQGWFGGPWLWARWLREGRRPPPSLRALILGASPVDAGFLRTLLAAAPARMRVVSLYGLTEAGPVAAVDGRDKVEWTGDGDLAGVVIPELEARIDEGEIQVRGGAVAPRYLDGSAADPWLRTGDLGRLEGRRLILNGRAKEMILRRGHNIYPGLLEPLLRRRLEDAVLVGVWDAEAHDERVVLAHTSADGSGVIELNEAAPDHVLRLETMPRTGRQHKVDREAIRGLARTRFRIPG